MFGNLLTPDRLIDAALSIYPPEKLKGLLNEHFQQILQELKAKAIGEFEKHPLLKLKEEESQYAFLAFDELDPETGEDGLFLLAVAINDDFDGFRALKAYNVRQELLKLDIKAIVAKMTIKDEGK
jgi:hypothetical protein